MYFPKPSLNENDLAIIERGDTATHAIEAGQYVSWKGKLGKAVSAILQGATLEDSLFDYETDGMLNDLNNNFYLGNGMTYVATSTQTVAQNSSYTAPEDGFYSIYASATEGSSSSAQWYLDSDKTIRILSAISGTIVMIPLKAGTTIYTRKNYGEYRVYGYLKW